MSSPLSTPLSGAVLLGHGSREPGTEAEIVALASELSQGAPEWRFAHAFLNQEPSLETAVESLASGGCTRVRVLPLLVFTGKHILEDIPREVERLRGLHPLLEIELEPHLSRHSGFAGLLAGALKNPTKPASQGTARS